MNLAGKPWRFVPPRAKRGCADRRKTEPQHVDGRPPVAAPRVKLSGYNIKKAVTLPTLKYMED